MKIVFNLKNFFVLIITAICICYSLPASTPIATVEVSQQPSISSYLKSIHTQITSLKESGELPKETIHVVLGNQSADMDSIVSAITLSYANSKKGLYVPVLNIPRDDLSLRRDVLYVFETLKIDPNSFLYQEDLPFILNLAKQGFIRITLVDHNRLAPDQVALEKYVERIIDHHKEEKSLYPLMKEDEKLITTMGSNSTLVAEKILSSNPDSISQDSAYLLLSAILLDTKDLKNEDVATEKDIAIGSLLKEKAGGYYKSTLFDVLYTSKNAAEHLTPDLALKKDYKLYKEGKLLYGIASIPKTIFWTAENRTQWKEVLVHSLEKQQIHLISALAFDGTDRFFIVYIPTLPLQKAFQSHIEQTANLQDKLILKEYFPEEGLLFFKLKSQQLGRKQLQPLLSFEKSDILQNAIP